MTANGPGVTIERVAVWPTAPIGRAVVLLGFAIPVLGAIMLLPANGGTAGDRSGTVLGPLAGATGLLMLAVFVLAVIRRAPRLTVALDLAFVVSAALLLAQPGGRHPLMMGLVALWGFVAATSAIEQLVHGHRTKIGAFSYLSVAVVCVILTVVGGSGIALKLKLLPYVGAMNDKAAAIPAGLPGQPQDYDSRCFDRGTIRGTIGPVAYTNCESAVAARSGDTAVSFDSPGEGIPDGSRGLIYAPSSLPSDAAHCHAHIIGDWYEYFNAARHDDQGCPAGLVR